MLSRAESYRRLWDFAVSDSAVRSQGWVLSALRSFGAELVTMLWRILGDEQDVCDCYQDTFLHLAHIDGGRKPSNVKGYILRTASNTAVSLLRRRCIEQRHLSALAASCREDISCERDFDAEAMRQSLRLGIVRLPEYLREVIVLRDLAELPYRQVGKILGISPGAARVYRHKAVQMLAILMKE